MAKLDTFDLDRAAKEAYTRLRNIESIISRTRNRQGRIYQFNINRWQTARDNFARLASYLPEK